jgi:hypothetical protein
MAKERFILHLHFYASIETINGIHNDHEMLVQTKEGKSYGAIHVSFDTSLYMIEKVVDSSTLYKVKKKK